MFRKYRPDFSGQKIFPEREAREKHWILDLAKAFVWLRSIVRVRSNMPLNPVCFLLICRSGVRIPLSTHVDIAQQDRATNSLVSPWGAQVRILQWTGNP